jgi:hypothetical protein
LILGAVPNTGPTQDSPDFAPAVRQAARLLAFDTVLADGAYGSRHATPSTTTSSAASGSACAR